MEEKPLNGTDGSVQWSAVSLFTALVCSGGWLYVARN